MKSNNFLVQNKTNHPILFIKEEINCLANLNINLDFGWYILNTYSRKYFHSPSKFNCNENLIETFDV